MIDACGLLSMYLLIKELHFGAILYFKLGDKNFDAGYIKCSHGAQVPHPCLRFSSTSESFASSTLRQDQASLEMQSHHLVQALGTYGSALQPVCKVHPRVHQNMRRVHH